MHTNNNKRRPNNMNGGNGGQHRHNNNRPRRFNNNSRPQNGEGGGDAASISRTRRNATQNREKYQMMARDAQSSGDRVLGEYYLQHADHYHRVLLALPPEEAPRPQYLRGHNPNGDQPGTDQPQEFQAQATPHDTHEESQQHSAPEAHALPSFITQSLVPENPEEHS